MLELHFVFCLIPILLHKNEIINITAKTSPPPKRHYDVKRTNHSLEMPPNYFIAKHVTVLPDVL